MTGIFTSAYSVSKRTGSDVPPPSRAASTQDQGNGNDPSANQRATSADRPYQRDGKAGKYGEGRGDKPGRRKDKPGKSK